MLLARWMLPVPHDVANLTNLFSPALASLESMEDNKHNTRKPNSSTMFHNVPQPNTTEQVSIPMVSLSTSSMMKSKLRRWESILYEISHNISSESRLELCGFFEFLATWQEWLIMAAHAHRAATHTVASLAS